MATMETTFTLYDRASAPLREINRTISAVMENYENLQAKMEYSIDPSGIRKMNMELSKTGKEFLSLGENIRIASQEMQKGGFGSGKLASGLKNLASKIDVAGGIKKAVALSDRRMETSSRLRLTVEDEGSVSELENKIMASAQRSRMAYFDTADAVAEFSRKAGSVFGGDTDQMIAFVEQANKQFTLGGASAEEQKSAMEQLTNAMASGVLKGEELRSVLEAAPEIGRAIEDYMGIAEGSIQSVADQGVVTSDVVKNALLSAAEGTEERFGAIPKTWSQIWTSMKNQALSVFSPILAKMNQVMNSSQFQQITAALMTGLAAVGGIASQIFGIIAGIASVIVDNWSMIGPAVLGAVAAFGAYQIAVNAAAAATRIASMATAVWEAVQRGFNAVMGLNPIFLIIIAVIALIAVIFLVVAAINKVLGTSFSALGIICAAVVTAGAIIGNLIIGLFNGIVQALWTIFVEPFFGIVEWILNVANGGFDSFGDAVLNLIGNIISWFLSLGKVVTKIIDAIFGTDWTASLSNLQDEVLAWGKNESSITLDRSAPEISERLNYSDLARGAYDWGDSKQSQISDKLKNGMSFDNISDLLKGSDLSQYGNLGTGGIAGSVNPAGLADAVSQTAENTGSAAENTDRIAGSVEMSNEELQWLREIAEREVINRYTTAEIRVEMNNNNTIASDMDIDGVVSLFEAKVAEALDISEEGVHN